MDHLTLAREDLFSHSLLEQAPYGVLVHRGDKILYANPELARMFGLSSPRAMLKFSYSDLLSPDCRDEAFAHDQVMWQEEQRTSHSRERRFIRDDGSAFCADVIGRVVEIDSMPALQLALVDVTERKARDARMKESEALTRILVSNNDGGVVLQALDSRVLAINPAAEEILGISGLDVLGEPADILANGFDESGQSLAGSHSPVLEAIQSSAPCRGRTVKISVQGRTRWLWFSAQPLVREGEQEPYSVLSSFKDITELQEAQAKLYFNANHDALTGLPNRRQLHEHMSKLLPRSTERGLPFAVACLGLDRFKDVNDCYGHPIGDRLLCEVGKRLTQVLRDTDWVARPGGDSFVLLLQDTDLEAAKRVVSRVLTQVATPFLVEGIEFYTSASLGLAMYRPGDSSTAEDLLKDADTAMYYAKGEGQLSYKVFESSMLNAARERIWLENNLRRGLDEGQFEVVYQPKTSTMDGSLAGVEALVRWNHPQRGLVSPAAFIEFAEESGLIVPLGRLVLEAACRQAKLWHDGGRSVPVAVNVSARQLKDDSLLSDIQEILNSTGLPAHLLELELTESTVVKNEEAVAELMQHLRTLGIKIYIDDFGTGYSSLSHLANLPLDALKIDLSFTARLTTEGKIQTLVRTILLLAKSLGMKVVAEGVETQEQLNCLRLLGCDEIQGYLVAKPLMAAELASWPRFMGLK